jgi:hypothetical protein
MKSCFYVAKSLPDAITFITQFMRIRGRKVDKVYIDYSFTSLSYNEWYDFNQRFNYLGIDPITVKEVNKCNH